MRIYKTCYGEYVDLKKIKHFWIESNYAWNKWIIRGDGFILTEVHYEKIHDTNLAKQKAQEWLDDLIAKLTQETTK